jgi:hypothetical protein
MSIKISTRLKNNVIIISDLIYFENQLASFTTEFMIYAGKSYCKCLDRRERVTKIQNIFPIIGFSK